MAEQKKLKVILLRHTLSPEEAIALSAKLCYSKSTIEDLKEKITQKDQSAFIEKLMGMGHESVLEHVTFSFGSRKICLFSPEHVEQIRKENNISEHNDETIYGDFFDFLHDGSLP